MEVEFATEDAPEGPQAADVMEVEFAAEDTPEGPQAADVTEAEPAQEGFDPSTLEI